MNYFDQIKHSYEELEFFSQKVAFCYRVAVGLAVCIPLLYAAGFLVGCVSFKNPIMAGSEAVKGLF